MYNMTFEQAKQYRDNLEAQLKHFSNEMNKFPKSPMGLTPDNVKQSPEFQIVDQAYKIHFKELQKFNQWFVKEFKKELAAERKNKYSKA